jgi:hypothetical protein
VEQLMAGPNDPDATDKALVADMRRDLAAMPEEQRQRIEQLAEVFRRAVREAGPVGYCALGLVGAEAAAGELV